MYDPIAMLRSMLETMTQRDLAARIGVSDQYLSDVLNNRRKLGKKIVEGLGLEKQVTYVKRKRA